MVRRFAIILALVACDSGKGGTFVEGADVPGGVAPGDIVGIGGPDDGSGADASTDAGPPLDVPPGDVTPPDAAQDATADIQEDTVTLDAGPLGCEEGATRCIGGASWVCFSGAWSKVQDCAELCIDGACVCAPDCSGKQCGPDGCGGTCGTCTNTACVDGACVPPVEPVVYSAVYVEDRWSGTCSGSSSPGADITGADLYTPAGQLVGNWVDVKANPGTQPCSNGYTDAGVTLGPPGSDQLSLGGGWVVGTFPGKNAIGPGWKITVYELGSQGGGTDEAFAVYLATDLDCPSKPDAKETCLKLVSEQGKGITSFTVE